MFLAEIHFAYLNLNPLSVIMTSRIVCTVHSRETNVKFRSCSFTILLFILIACNSRNFAASQDDIFATSYPGQQMNKTCISHKDIVTAPSGSLIHPFNVSSLLECWEYCKYSSLCDVFMFKMHARTCSLFQEIEFKFRHDFDSEVFVGEMVCLECLGGVDDVINQSTSGVLIEGPQGLCATSSAESIGTNQKEEFHLVWKSCKTADLWVFQRSKERGYDTVGVSKFNSNMVMDWKVGEDKFATAFVRNNSSIPPKGMLLELGKNVQRKLCLFSLFGPTNTKENSYNLFTGNTMINGRWDDRDLFQIGISLPLSKQKCSLRKTSVKKGLVLNPKKLPFFLPGSTITVQCKAGFGIESKNFSSVQKLKCSPEVTPTPCSAIINVRSKKGMSNHNSVTVMISGISVMLPFTCLIVCSLIYCRHLRLKNSGNVEQVERGEISLDTNNNNKE